MSGLDLASIRRRHERAVAYWQAMDLSWVSPSSGQDARRAAYLGVIRDIPALLEALELVTAQRDDAWKQLDPGDAR